MIRAGSMARVFLLAGLMGLACVGASAEPKVTYVGLGRYSCSGTAAECAKINYNNRRASAEARASAKRRTAAATRKNRTARNVSLMRPAVGSGNAGGNSRWHLTLAK